MILAAATAIGLGIGFSAEMGLLSEEAEMLLAIATTAASTFVFSVWLEERSKSRHKGACRGL